MLVRGIRSVCVVRISWRPNSILYHFVNKRYTSTLRPMYSIQTCNGSVKLPEVYTYSTSTLRGKTNYSNGVPVVVVWDEDTKWRTGGSGVG